MGRHAKLYGFVFDDLEASQSDKEKKKIKSTFILKQSIRVTETMAVAARCVGRAMDGWMDGGGGGNHIMAACGYVVTLVGPLLMWLETPCRAIINIDPVPFFTLESILPARRSRSNAASSERKKVA